MNKTSIPAFVENIIPDTANAKYSKAKLRMYYVGETCDRRLFTKEFSDKLISTIAYTPVVGYYSIADEDFVGHNNVQNIYGIVPADAVVEYVEDPETGTTFAVTDIILYTGRPDETGAIASKIVGKQHSLELDPSTVKYKINRDENGNFKNLEFTDGELIGLSVLGDNDTPAFTGSEFFTAEEKPDFITEENESKYKTLFTAMFSVQPTAQEVVDEIYRAMESQRIYGYVCEHIENDYVVVTNSEWGVYSRYTLDREEDGSLKLTFDTNVRKRFISDSEIEALSNVKKGLPSDVQETENIETTGTETNTNSDSTPFVDNTEEINQLREELETVRSNYASLEELNNSLAVASEVAKTTVDSLNALCREIMNQFYGSQLEADQVDAILKSDATVQDMQAAFIAAIEEKERNADAAFFEITTINDSTFTYDENDEVAVVEKYKNTNRGKN